MSFLSLYYYAMLGWILWGVSVSQVQKYLRQGTLSRTFQLFLGERTVSHSFTPPSWQLCCHFSSLFTFMFCFYRQTNRMYWQWPLFFFCVFSLSFCCHCEMEYYKKEKLNIAIFCLLLWMWRLVFSGVVLLAGFLLLLLLLMWYYKVLVHFFWNVHIYGHFFFILTLFVLWSTSIYFYNFIDLKRQRMENDIILK